MINYSIFMMANPIKPDMPEKAYAKNQVSEIWTLEKFSKHIADHNGVYSRGTVKGVLSDTCECLVERMRTYFPKALVVGHHDLNPMKACPCFDVVKEFLKKT